MCLLLLREFCLKMEEEEGRKKEKFYSCVLGKNSREVRFDSKVSVFVRTSTFRIEICVVKTLLV